MKHMGRGIKWNLFYRIRTPTLMGENSRMEMKYQTLIGENML
jgi:hypothetical protein